MVPPVLPLLHDSQAIDRWLLLGCVPGIDILLDIPERSSNAKCGPLKSHPLCSFARSPVLDMFLQQTMAGWISPHHPRHDMAPGIALMQSLEIPTRDNFIAYSYCYDIN